MKVFPRCLALITLAALIAVPMSGCKPKPSERPATVTTDAKEKHTKTKAHKRDKKAAKEKAGKSGGDKKAAKPTPQKPA